MVNSDLGKHFLLVYSQDAKLLYTEHTECALEKFHNGHYSVIYSALFPQTFAHRRRLSENQAERHSPRRTVCVCLTFERTVSFCLAVSLPFARLEEQQFSFIVS